jgi:hypothetical protein
MSGDGTYRANGHEFEVVAEYEDDESIRCTDCMLREVLSDDKDPDDYLELMTPECHIEWLRQPDGGFRGIALRNASGFQGRELIAVDSDGEVTDTIRVYDDDAPLLGSLLDRSDWKRREPQAETNRDGGELA